MFKKIWLPAFFFLAPLLATDVLEMDRELTLPPKVKKALQPIKEEKNRISFYSYLKKNRPEVAFEDVKRFIPSVAFLINGMEDRQNITRILTALFPQFLNTKLSSKEMKECVTNVDPLIKEIKNEKNKTNIFCAFLEAKDKKKFVSRTQYLINHSMSDECNRTGIICCFSKIDYSYWDYVFPYLSNPSPRNWEAFGLHAKTLRAYIRNEEKYKQALSFFSVMTPSEWDDFLKAYDIALSDANKTTDNDLNIFWTLYHLDPTQRKKVKDSSLRKK